MSTHLPPNCVNRRKALAALSAVAAAFFATRTRSGADPGDFDSRLIAAANQLAGNVVKYGPDANGTKCNFFARDLVENVVAATVTELEPDNSSTGAGGQANQLFDKLLAGSLASQPTWTDITEATDWNATYAAAAASARTTPVVAVWKNTVGGHGHIAVVMPFATVTGYSGEEDINSGNGLKVPIVAQATDKRACSPTGVDAAVALSCAFGASRQPDIRFFKRN
jgi:hypothetical protein